MSSIKDVSEAIVGRLQPVLPGWNMHWFEQSPFSIPYLCVTPESGISGDFRQNLGSYTKWSLRVSLFYNAVDQDSAHEAIGALIDPDGLIVATMTDEDAPDDALRAMCGLNIEATTTRGWMMIRRNRARYLFGDIGFDLGAN